MDERYGAKSACWNRSADHDEDSFAVPQLIRNSFAVQWTLSVVSGLGSRAQHRRSGAHLGVSSDVVHRVLEQAYRPAQRECPPCRSFDCQVECEIHGGIEFGPTGGDA